MPPKKAKVKVRKTSKSGDKGVKINIVIDQSKKTKGGVPKAPIQKRALPAFSAMPQGPSYMGANFPARQDAPTIDIQGLGDKIFNNLLAEGYRREQSARGFGSFQTAGQQLNQIFDGQYSTGRNNFPIISEPTNRVADYLDEAVSDEPTTNNQILSNKLNNRGSRLPPMDENSIGQLNLDEKRDNALDNLVLHEKKSKVEAKVNADLDEDLLEEEGDEDLAFVEINSPTGQAQRAKELSLQSEEDKYQGRTLSAKMKAKIYEIYSLPPIPPPKKATVQELKDYINFLNDSFGTSYETNFKGRRAVDDLRRVIRIALLNEYDEMNS